MSNSQADRLAQQVSAGHARIIKALANVVNCDRTDAQFNADVLPRDPVMADVMRVREAADAMMAGARELAALAKQQAPRLTPVGCGDGDTYVVSEAPRSRALHPSWYSPNLNAPTKQQASPDAQPVALVTTVGDIGGTVLWSTDTKISIGTKLYATPPSAPQCEHGALPADIARILRVGWQSANFNEVALTTEEVNKVADWLSQGTSQAAGVGEQATGGGVDKWDAAAGEEWMPLAWELCANECGEEACTELVWEGGPVPEPWGDRWLKYESQAREMIEMVRKHVPSLAAPAPAQAEPMSDAKISKIARAFSDRISEACGVDPIDHWTHYSDEAKADVLFVLAEAGIKEKTQTQLPLPKAYAAQIIVPNDMRKPEAEQLCAFIMSLVVEQEKTNG